MVISGPGWPEERVIAYASRNLSKSERNYPVHKLEFLALKWAITNKFHEYLYGAEFQVFTDNNPLTYVLTTARWMLHDISGLLPCPTAPLASYISLARLTEMLMPCLELNGIRQWMCPLNQCMFSARECRHHMTK